MLLSINDSIIQLNLKLVIMSNSKNILDNFYQPAKVLSFDFKWYDISGSIGECSQNVLSKSSVKVPNTTKL